jgi:hypothetical protein
MSYNPNCRIIDESEEYFHLVFDEDKARHRAARYTNKFGIYLHKDSILNGTVGIGDVIKVKLDYIYRDGNGKQYVVVQFLELIEQCPTVDEYDIGPPVYELN